MVLIMSNPIGAAASQFTFMQDLHIVRENTRRRELGKPLLTLADVKFELPSGERISMEDVISCGYRKQHANHGMKPQEFWLARQVDVVSDASSSTSAASFSPPSSPTLSESSAGTEFSFEAEVERRAVVPPPRIHIPVAPTVSVPNPEYVSSDVESILTPKSDAKPALTLPEPLPFTLEELLAFVESPAPLVDPSREHWTLDDIQAFTDWFNQALSSRLDLTPTDIKDNERQILELIAEMPKLPGDSVSTMRRFLTLPPESKEAQALVSRFAELASSGLIEDSPSVLSETTTSVSSDESDAVTANFGPGFKQLMILINLILLFMASGRIGEEG